MAAASNSSESGYHTQSLFRREASVSAPVTGRWRHEQQRQFWALDGEFVVALVHFVLLVLVTEQCDGLTKRKILV